MGVCTYVSVDLSQGVCVWVRGMFVFVIVYLCPSLLSPLLSQPASSTASLPPSLSSPRYVCGG